MNSKALLVNIKKLSKLTLAAAIIETILIIPGVALITFWTPLVALLILYIISLRVTDRTLKNVKTNSFANQLQSIRKKYVWGIICEIISFIPFIGWLLHLVIAIIMWRQFRTLRNFRGRT